MKPTVFLVFLFLHLCGEISVSYSASIRAKRDLKIDLLANAQLLLSRACNGITELLLQNRSHEARSIAMYANATKSLVERLNGSTNETEINDLKASLDNMEGNLLIEFAKVGLPTFDYEELRLALIIYGEQIIERAIRDIEKFKQQNKTNYVSSIEYYLKPINESVNQLRNATLMIDVFGLEGALTSQVTRLEKVLFTEGVGWDLENIRYIELERANDLVKKLNALIDQLKNSVILSENKTEIMIVGIEDTIRDITNITAHLRNATDNNTIATLSFELSAMELDVERNLAIFSIKSIGTQEREALLRAIEQLSAKFLDKEKRLNELNRTAEANLLNDDYLELRDLVASVRNAVNPVEFFFLESKFKDLESEFSVFVKFYKLDQI